ncbi:MAG TPA: hypothetical protein VND23_01920 [Acidimicrobiales bacterium]|nr:hypothetical protein [Acidimicrobiales bacterium]
MVDASDDEFALQREQTMAVLLAELPELAPIVSELEDVLGDPPGVHLVFCELAELAVRLLGRVRDEDDEVLLERIFEAVEAVAMASGVDHAETVGFGFLANLGPGPLAHARLYLLGATEQVLEQYLSGELELTGE